MLKGITRLASLICLAALALSFPVSGQAADKDATAEPPGKNDSTVKEKRSDRVPFRGKLAAVDKKNMTISIEGKEKQRVIQITSQTRIMKAGKPATLDDATVGEQVAGQLTRTPDGKEEANSLRIGAMPLSPAVPFRGFNRHAVMIADDIRERLQTQRSRVILVRAPRSKLQVRYCADHLRVIAKRKLGPLLGDLVRAQVGVPCQTSEAVQIRLRQVVPEPVVIQAHVRNAHDRVHPRFHWRRAPANPQVEIESLFPHRHQEHGVPGLTHVFLGDLQLNRLFGFRQRPEQR